MVDIVTPSNALMNGTVKELTLHVTTLMNLSTVTWNAMSDVVQIISVMGLKVDFP
jgi:hypothetical protein